MNTFTVMAMSPIGCVNKFIVSVGLNKETKACPQHALAGIQSAMYYHTKTQPGLEKLPLR